MELGTTCTLQGRLDEAQQYLEEALSIRQRALGDDHHLTAQSLAQLGIILKDQGDTARARTCYERALAIFEAQFGPEYAELEEVRERLAKF